MRWIWWSNCTGQYSEEWRPTAWSYLSPKPHWHSYHIHSIDTKFIAGAVDNGTIPRHIPIFINCHLAAILCPVVSCGVPEHTYWQSIILKWTTHLSEGGRNTNANLRTTLKHSTRMCYVFISPPLTPPISLTSPLPSIKPKEDAGKPWFPPTSPKHSIPFSRWWSYINTIFFSLMCLPSTDTLSIWY